MGSSHVAWMDPVLRSFSAISTSRGLTLAGSFPGSLGTAEIQEASDSHDEGMGLAAADSGSSAETVSSLGSSVVGWTIGAG